MSQTSLHPLDRATLLSQNSDGSLTGRKDPACAHAVGSFGGITVAALLNAVFTRSTRLGDPFSQTANYAGPIADDKYRVEAVPVCTNRSTQHWSIALSQGGEVATTATVVAAVRPHDRSSISRE